MKLYCDVVKKVTPFIAAPRRLPYWIIHCCYQIMSRERKLVQRLVNGLFWSRLSNLITIPDWRLLRKNDIRVVNKPLKTLQREFPSPKFRQPSDFQCNVVYKIPCEDCSWNYIGETGRCFRTRKKEHQRNLKNYSNGSNACVIVRSNLGTQQKLSTRITTQNRCLGNTLFYCNQASFTFLSSSVFHACFYSQFFAPHSYIFSLARHIFHSLKAIDW